ncbi:hypothetical protein [Jannaschia sp. M317]|uniref:hypothetical protein n=1 Tax=Jannaschia sp. M317 TaxID=2867011 RepID=UPI0021A2A254|nr:hypothetical protein [Jannaschia sp. M317]UWQ18054.1 hypothetical protein K3551_01740 [Jannaschia sp. M317]
MTRQKTTGADPSSNTPDIDLDRAKEPLETGKAKAEATGEAVKRRAETLKDRAGEKLRETAEAATDSAREKVDAKTAEVRNSMADTVDGAASTLYEAAERMTDGSPQAEAVDRAADYVAGAAAEIRNKDIASLGEDVAGFARRHPGAFVAAAALAGFAAGRFLKASAREVPPAYPSTGYHPPAPRPTTMPTAASTSDVTPHHVPPAAPAPTGGA